jgi:hypothetical protein
VAQSRDDASGARGGEAVGAWGGVEPGRRRGVAAGSCCFRLERGSAFGVLVRDGARPNVFRSLSTTKIRKQRN